MTDQDQIDFIDKQFEKAKLISKKLIRVLEQENKKDPTHINFLNSTVALTLAISFMESQSPGIIGYAEQIVQLHRTQPPTGPFTPSPIAS